MHLNDKLNIQPSQESTGLPTGVFKTTYTRKEFWLLNLYSILAIVGIIYITAQPLLFFVLIPLYILFFLWLCVGRIRYLGFSNIVALLFIGTLISTMVYLVEYSQIMDLGRKFVHIEELSQSVADISINSIGAALMFIVMSFFYSIAFYIKIEVSVFSGKVSDLRSIESDTMTMLDKIQFIINDRRFTIRSSSTKLVANEDEIKAVAWQDHNGNWNVSAIWNKTKGVKEFLSSYLMLSILSFLLFFTGLYWVIKLTPEKIGFFVTMYSILFVNGLYSLIKYRMLRNKFGDIEK